MNILSKIFNKIFSSAHADVVSNPAESQAAPGSTAVPGTNATTQAASAPPNHALEIVDVEAILDDLAKKKNETLNWRTSIVDLLKLLDLDSSLQARKGLADELNYSGDNNDSASMNIWLHRQVMNKLAQNGGNVPADLKD